VHTADSLVCAVCLEIREPQPGLILRVSPGVYADSFTFYKVKIRLKRLKYFGNLWFLCGLHYFLIKE
jgi:hypothetical protein